MDILRYILLGIDGVIALVLIVLMLLQTNKSDGASGTIVGSSSSNDGYFSNNKDRSRDGKLRRTTIVSGIAFMILTYVLGLLFLL